MKTQGHRLFFALQPGAETLKRITLVQREAAGVGGRATPAGRIHATLLFLGQQSRETLIRLREIAPNLDFPVCSLALDRVGYFPRARVAWLGPSSVPPELETFQARLSHAVDSAGIRFDQRRWRLHLTLYRDLRTPPGRLDFEPVEWRPEGFQLLESIQDRSGLRYHGQGHWPA